MAAKKRIVTPENRGPLGQHLWDLRNAARMTVREAEEASEVSNAYISQIENGKITKPSPHILYQLAEAYKGSYERLMELAGHIKKNVELPEQRRGRLATFATEDLTAEEEDELLK